MSSGPADRDDRASDADHRSPVRLPEGTRLRNQYVIGPVLGAGSFGITYRAHDDWLDTTVAIKEYYPRHLAGRTKGTLTIKPTSTDEAEDLEFGLRRFLEEGRTLARFDHPNIVRVRSYFEAHGTGYLVMDYYEGDSLDEYLPRQGGRLSEIEAVRLLHDVLDGLQAVHAEEVLHRDIDPGNVYRTVDGKAVLLDFGAARAAVTERTQDLSVIFKPGYAPYEQYQNDGTQGPWTDVYACAATLYKCLTGIRPPEASQRKAEDELLPPHKVQVDVSMEVSVAVMKGLAIDPKRRPESAEAFSALLTEALENDAPARHSGASSPTKEQVSSDASSSSADADSSSPFPNAQTATDARTAIGTQSTPDSASSASSSESRSKIPFPIPLLVGTLLLILLGSAWWFTQDADSSSPPSQKSVAVLPFKVSGTETKEWEEGMVTVLSTGIDGAAGLRAVDDRTVFATWDDTPVSGQSDTERSLRVARRIGAQYAVVGSAVALGSDLRFSVDVHDVKSGDEIGSVRVQGSPDSLMTLADQLTRQVLGVLLKKGADVSVDIASFTTRSLPALKSLLAGEHHFRDGNYQAAVDDYRSAIKKDSTFALAFARLGASLDWLGYHEDASQARRRAVRLSDRLTRRERWMVEVEHLVKEKQLISAAVDTLQKMVNAYPDDAKVWYTRGESFFHGILPPGWSAAEQSLERATNLAPGVVPYQRHLIALAFSLHHDRALATERLATFPDGTQKRLYQIADDIVFGTKAQRERAFGRLDTVTVRGRSLQQFTPLTNSLKHPTDVSSLLKAFQVLDARSSTGAAVERWLPIVHFRMGQVDAATARLQDDPAQSGACLLAREHSIGTPLPDSLLRTRLTPSALPSNPSLSALHCSGLYLATTGRTAAFEQVLQRIEARDSIARRRVLLDELKGYRAWKNGNRQRAERLMAGTNASRWWGALWRGDLYRTLGKREKAESWYTTAWEHPVAHERLGRLYRQMGKPREAAAAYRRFIRTWMDADSSLRPRVQRARDTLQKITGAAARE